MVFNVHWNSMCYPFRVWCFLQKPYTTGMLWKSLQGCIYGVFLEEIPHPGWVSRPKLPSRSSTMTLGVRRWPRRAPRAGACRPPVHSLLPGPGPWPGPRHWPGMPVAGIRPAGRPRRGVLLDHDNQPRRRPMNPFKISGWRNTSSRSSKRNTVSGRISNTRWQFR